MRINFLIQDSTIICKGSEQERENQEINIAANILTCGTVPKRRSKRTKFFKNGGDC